MQNRSRQSKNMNENNCCEYSIIWLYIGLLDFFMPGYQDYIYMLMKINAYAVVYNF